MGAVASRERGKEMTDFVKVAKADEINPGQARLIDVKGKQIAVFNINGDFFAIDNMYARGGFPSRGRDLGTRGDLPSPWSQIRRSDRRSAWSAGLS